MGGPFPPGPNGAGGMMGGGGRGWQGMHGGGKGGKGGGAGGPGGGRGPGRNDPSVFTVRCAGIPDNVSDTDIESHFGRYFGHVAMLAPANGGGE